MAWMLMRGGFSLSHLLFIGGLAAPDVRFCAALAGALEPALLLIKALADALIGGHNGCGYLSTGLFLSSFSHEVGL
ncbi:hypothetical protein EA797_16160 [Stutzerimonas zhaodongensis]|uniref:Uncharacterized protein n=1 Tax=Stutzerimonas zhaodongensis TaxID=1176257 RepID=A0A3M2HGC9_9GAMM|nr:hypothetical protein EA797_16160 [Stutzerimonas zhaodongensis]